VMLETELNNANSSSNLIFDQCIATNSLNGNNNITDLLVCISNSLQTAIEQVTVTSSLSLNGSSNNNASYPATEEPYRHNSADGGDSLSFQEDHDTHRSIILIVAAVLVFIMQAGFAMVCAGAVRKKNIQNTMLKNLLDTCGAAVAFYTFGFALAFGGSNYDNPQKTFMGTANFLLWDVQDLSFWLFNYAFSAASVTIVAGTLAERCQMAAYLCYAFVLTGWVYPIVAHTIWSPQGFLSAHTIQPLWNSGMIDFAGASTVHVTGGCTALFAAIILGPRRGRFQDDEGNRLTEPAHFPGSNVGKIDDI
jgi:Ammonium Transporter Family